MLRRLGRELVILAIGAVLFGGLYALLQLAVYGHVKW